MILYITTLKRNRRALMDYYILGGQILTIRGQWAKRASDRMFIHIDEIDENDDPETLPAGKKGQSIDRRIAGQRGHD